MMTYDLNAIAFLHNGNSHCKWFSIPFPNLSVHVQAIEALVMYKMYSSLWCL